MSKGKQARNQAARGKAKSSRQQEIRSEIRHCIKGRTVDLSTASEYYRKCWEAVSPRVEEEFKKKGPSHYELKPRFFRFFLDHLNELVSRHYGRSEMNAGDCAARALYRAALLVGRTKTPLTGPCRPANFGRAHGPSHRLGKSSEDYLCRAVQWRLSRCQTAAASCG